MHEFLRYLPFCAIFFPVKNGLTFPNCFELLRGTVFFGSAKPLGGSGTVMQLDEVNSILHYMSIKPYGVLGVGKKRKNQRQHQPPTT